MDSGIDCNTTSSKVLSASRLTREAGLESTHSVVLVDAGVLELVVISNLGLADIVVSLQCCPFQSLLCKVPRTCPILTVLHDAQLKMFCK